MTESRPARPDPAVPRFAPELLSLQTSRRIDVERLLDALGPAAEGLVVLAVDSCASTNALLVDNLQEKWPHAAAVLCVADRQTAGRGRRGRNWVSSPEASLTFSLARRFERGADLSGLSLAVGLALRDGLARAGVDGVLLKWPNDLVCAGAGGGFAKLGGILVELTSGRTTTAAVIGVGINLFKPAGEFGQAAAGLDALATLPARHRLLAEIVLALGEALDAFAREGFAPRRAAWNAAHAYNDRQVLLHVENGAPIPGCCIGADADGALRVRTADGETRWMAGDVSLRGTEHGI